MRLFGPGQRVAAEGLLAALKRPLICGCAGDADRRTGSRPKPDRPLPDAICAMVLHDQPQRRILGRALCLPAERRAAGPGPGARHRSQHARSVAAAGGLREILVHLVLGRPRSAVGQRGWPRAGRPRTWSGSSRADVGHGVGLYEASGTARRPAVCPMRWQSRAACFGRRSGRCSAPNGRTAPVRVFAGLGRTAETSGASPNSGKRSRWCRRAGLAAMALNGGGGQGDGGLGTGRSSRIRRCRHFARQPCVRRVSMRAEAGVTSVNVRGGVLMFLHCGDSFRAQHTSLLIRARKTGLR